ncbi:MAG: hypothetical protein HUU33_15270 [Flavobacteriales bacterium]|nr:hypothetical protein [Flavobacteriales bacterium]
MRTHRLPWVLVLVLLTAPVTTVAQPPMVTKYLHEFDTFGAGHPNDLINDQPALLKAAADAWMVADNTVLLVSNAHNRTGIQLEGCRATEVSCNNISSSDNTYQTANGILFNGVAYNTDVRGNQFHDHNWPLHLDATAIIDAQVLKGNLWDPNAAPPVWGAWYESVLGASNNPFYYNPATINGGNTQPPSFWPPGWFATDPGPNYDCADHHGVDYCSQFGSERCGECLLELDQMIAGDSLVNDPYTEETKWILAADLYKKLDDAPALLDSLPELDDFYGELQGSNTAAFKAIDDDQLALYDMDSSVVAQLQQNRAMIDSLLGLLKDGLEQLGDSTLTTAQREVIIAGISSYREDIKDLSEWNTSAIQVAWAAKVLIADGVKTANAGIGESELIETNQKQVNEIYLATIGKDIDVFTSGQASALFDIASQCPMRGGNAVFKARSLYWLIDDSVDFDDAALCLPYGIVVKALAEYEPSGVTVIPNPAKDEAMLVLATQLDGAGVFVLFDAIGAEIMRYRIPANMPRFAFSTASLAPALYHYQVRGPSDIIGYGKLTIVR